MAIDVVQFCACRASEPCPIVPVHRPHSRSHQERPAELAVDAEVMSGDQVNPDQLESRLSDGVHPPVTLDAGAPPTTAFNGSFVGTTWSATLTSLSTIGLPMPRCSALGQSDPYPDLSIEITLACESDSP